MTTLWNVWWNSGDEYFKREEGNGKEVGLVFSIGQGVMDNSDIMKVCRCLGLLISTQGKLLVRDAYKVMFERMEKASEEISISGVVITGQPGIGATPCSLSPSPTRALPLYRQIIVFRPRSCHLLVKVTVGRVQHGARDDIPL